MAELPLPPLEPAVWQGAQACRLGLHQALCSLAASPSATTGGATPLHEGVREVVCIDKNFAFWPLDEPEVMHALSIWLRKPGRRLSLLALDYATTALSLPRFSRWRRDYAHCINAWQPVEGGIPAGLRGFGAAGRPCNGRKVLPWNFVASPIRCNWPQFVQRVQTFCNVASRPGPSRLWVYRWHP